MKQLVILSGKGGTGKTITTAALAHLAAGEMPLVLVDADVDAANLELVLNPTRLERHDFSVGKIASINVVACTACGRCVEVCRFDAVAPGDHYRIRTVNCEGCAACFYQCPVGAIQMVEVQAGEWYRSDTRYGPLLHAHLFAGQENSGKLVTLVKQMGRAVAKGTGATLLLIDGPPGIGCPVISAVSGANLALLVAEPTISGVHDLERVLATTNHFGIQALVVINKADLNEKRAAEIDAFCRERGAPVIGRIPYDDAVTEAMVRGLPATAYRDGPVSRAFGEVWSTLKARLTP